MASSKGSSSSSKSSSVSIKIGGKTINMTTSQLASLTPATKAALGASIKSGAASYSVNGTVQPASKAAADKLPDTTTGSKTGTTSGSGTSTPKPIVKSFTDPMALEPVGGTTKVAPLGGTTPEKEIKPNDISGVIDTSKTDTIHNAATNNNVKSTQFTDTTVLQSQLDAQNSNLAKGEVLVTGQSAAPAQKYVAPNAKSYDLKVDPVTGQTEFISQATGKPRVFNSMQDAIDEINLQNPGTNQNQLTKEGLPQSEVPAINQMYESAKDYETKIKKTAENVLGYIQPYIDNIGDANNAWAKTTSNVINDRISNMSQSFSTITSQITDLEKQANSLFDVEKMNAIRAREQGLAAQGILTSEQSAASGERLVQDFVNQKETERQALLKSAAEMKINAEKERMSMNDQIMQQQGIDATTKQQMSQAVNTMYQNLYTNYGSMLEGANTAYINAMNTANQAKVQVDVTSAAPMIEERVKTQLSTIQKEKANSDLSYRYDYILGKLGEIDGNLKRYATSVISKDIQNKSFMTQPIDAYISSLISKIMPQYRADTK